jgi:hypothetical protein
MNRVAVFDVEKPMPARIYLCFVINFNSERLLGV